MDKLTDATTFQKTFLWIMAAKQVENQIIMDTKLTGIAKGLGVEFKNKTK